MTVHEALSTTPHLSRIVVAIGRFCSAALATPWVTFILVPLVVTLGAIGLKACSRKTIGVESSDLLVGFDLGATACITLLISGYLVLNQQPATEAALGEKQHYLFGLFVVLFGFICLLGVGAWSMHKRGWNLDGKTVNKSWMFAVNLGGAILLVMAFILCGGAAT